MKILTDKPSAFKLFIEDMVIPMLPFVVVGVIGIVTFPVLRWIAGWLP